MYPSIQLQGRAFHGVSFMLLQSPESWFLPTKFKDNSDPVDASFKDYDLFEH